MIFWLTLSPAYIEPLWAAEESSLRFFANGSQFGPVGPSASQKNFKIITNKINEY